VNDLIQFCCEIHYILTFQNFYLDDGRCSAECDCPFNVMLEKSGEHPGKTADGHEPCWASAGLTRGAECRIFEINLKSDASSLKFHSVTGFSKILPLADVLTAANPTLERATPGINKVMYVSSSSYMAYMYPPPHI
jgi:hypothetical protein